MASLTAAALLTLHPVLRAVVHFYAFDDCVLLNATLSAASIVEL